jgi:hypothetical protein
MANVPPLQPIFYYAAKWWLTHARRTRKAAREVLDIKRDLFRYGAQWATLNEEERVHRSKFPTPEVGVAWWHIFC